MANARIIPSKINPNTLNPIGQVAKRRVAIYAIIGGRDEDSLENIKCVLAYVTSFAEKCKYQVVKAYGDYGCENKDGVGNYGGFNQLMEDAKKGEFDLILTKSISRFSRNTIKTIEIIKELKGLGVGVHFEKESICSFSSDAEPILNLIYSIAKEEQTSILEATKKWQKSQ